jgi:hypothetical protein
MTRITNNFIRTHFSADCVEDIGGGWAGIRDAVLNARRICSDAAKFPRANFDYLEKLDLEGTSFLLGAPVQYIV